MRTISTTVTALTGSLRNDIGTYGTMSKLDQRCRQMGKSPFLQLNWPLPDNCVWKFCTEFHENPTGRSVTDTTSQTSGCWLHIRHYTLLRAEGLITNIKAHNVAEQQGPSLYTAACYINVVWGGLFAAQSAALCVYRTQQKAGLIERPWIPDWPQK